MRGSPINIATYYNCGTSLTLPSFFAFVFKKSFTKNFTFNFLFEADALVQLGHRLVELMTNDLGKEAESTECARGCGLPSSAGTIFLG